MIVENRSWKYSLLLHVALFLVAAFGLPVLLPDMPEPQPMVMTVDILPISAMTNVRQNPDPIQKAQQAKTPNKVKPTPPKPTPPKQQPKVDKPVEEKPFDPNEDAEPVKKKETAPKEQDKPSETKTEDDFEKLLADLNKQADETKKDAKDARTVAENKTQSDAPFDESAPLSISETDAIRNAYRECWSFDAGGKDAASMIVRMQVKYNPNGTVKESRLDPTMQGRYNSDTYFRAAVEAAKRAILLPSCNPLKNLPPDLYPRLGNRNILFDPSKM